MPGEAPEGARSGLVSGVVPPLTDEELGTFAPKSEEKTPLPIRKRSSSSAFRRAVGGVLAFAFGALFLFLTLELIQTINLLLDWPIYMGWPVLALILGGIGYGIYRLCRILISIRRMPIVTRLEPGELETLDGDRKNEIRRQLCAQLAYLEEQGSETAQSIAPALARLKSQSISHPAGEWIRDYNREVLEPLGKAARSRVRTIALTAGASAALSPWKILDAIVAFNAATQAAYEVLSIHGIRPSQSVAFAFAFDTFLNTFLATVVEDVAGDLADSLMAQISAESGASVAKILAPKIAEGLTTAVFVRRLGNRMVRRLHPFPQ